MIFPYSSRKTEISTKFFNCYFEIFIKVTTHWVSDASTSRHGVGMTSLLFPYISFMHHFSSHLSNQIILYTVHPSYSSSSSSQKVIHNHIQKFPHLSSFPPRHMPVPRQLRHKHEFFVLCSLGSGSILYGKLKGAPGVQMKNSISRKVLRTLPKNGL